MSELSIGTVTLNPIKFNVSSSLLGLNSLNTQPTLIEGVDVLGGTPDHINLAINVSIFNPSNVNLQVGDVFLALFNNGSEIGTTLLPNLNLVRGGNQLSVSGNFTPNDNRAGQLTLDNFVGGKDTNLAISGYPNSTKVLSLLSAFEALKVNTTLPGLDVSLINSTTLVILPTTGYANNISSVTVNLLNPFTAALDITSINSSVSSYGIPLGTIETATNFPSNGHSVTTSPSLPLDMNLDPPALFTLLRALAVSVGLPTVQIDGIVQLGGYQYLPTTNETESTGKGDDQGLLPPGVAVLDERGWVDEAFTSVEKRDNIYT